MTSFPASLARLAAIAAAIATVIALPGAAFAKTGAKGVTITVPSGALADESSKLCMPRTVVNPRDRTQPATLCLTRDQWLAQGITIVLK